jgi:hypothetical protein
MTDTLTRESVTEALRVAGHSEATDDRTGFMAFRPDAGTRIIVVPCLDEHMEGHWDSPAHHDAMARMTGEYQQALEAAGWVVVVHPSGEGLTVTGYAKAV